MVQDKLVDMVSDHTRGLLLSWRLAVLKDQGKMGFTQVSLAKRENVRAALNAARSAREILGGSGIVLEHPAIRHMLNLETVDTYEGTHDVHTLILGTRPHRAQRAGLADSPASSDLQARLAKSFYEDNSGIAGVQHIGRDETSREYDSSRLQALPKPGLVVGEPRHRLDRVPQDVGSDPLAYHPVG